MDRNALISLIEEEAARRNLKVSTLCTYAANDGKFHSRLTSGGRFWPETGEKVLHWIESTRRSQDDDA